MTTIDPISQFYARLGKYPGNNKQWWQARAAADDTTAGLKAGDFTPEMLDKLFSGNMRAPRGHYVLDAFNKDRSAVSGITGIPAVTVSDRPPAVAFFSGRAWFACNSFVYFSQVLSEKSKVGKCYQEADPTSEQISDIIATDGGVIPIPEATKIIRMMPHGGGIMVFATNGVWYITGSNSGFSALDIAVNKVSPIGCRSPFSVIQTDAAVFWWSDVGIMGAAQSAGQFGPIAGRFDKQNITEETVQTLYNNIPIDIRGEVKVAFDPKANTLVWLYRDSDALATQYNRALIFDLTLQAFYPWKFSQLASGSPKIKGFVVSERLNTYTVPTDIMPSQIEYISLKDTELRVNQVRSGSFADWKTANGVGIKYDSYIETGYELFNDAMRNKNITYLFAYLKRTETSADVSGNVDYPSSCYMTVKFDWSSGGQSNRWTAPVQVYRPGRFFFDPDTGFGMNITKNKVRGNGKSLQFRFGTDEIGKNFDLQGWSLAVTGNTHP